MSNYQLVEFKNGSGAEDFYTQLSALDDRIKAYSRSVARIGELHSRALSSTNDSTTSQIESDLARLTEEARAESQHIKGDLQFLRGGATGAQRTQIQRITENFKSSVQQYQHVEMQYRRGVQDRLKRQFKIVQPDATPEQLDEVANNPNTQVFSQALVQSDRYGQSRTAYREVQSRHEDLKQIEQTMAELAQLFNDLSLLVNQQDEVVNNIEKSAYDADLNMEQGTKEMTSAVSWAEKARRHRKMLFVIIVVLIIVIVIIAAVAVCTNGGCAAKSN